MKELIAFSPYEAGLLMLRLCLLVAVWLPVTLLRRYVTLPFIPILGGMALFWYLPDALMLDPFSADKLSVWERWPKRSWWSRWWGRDSRSTRAVCCSPRPFAACSWLPCRCALLPSPCSVGGWPGCRCRQPCWGPCWRRPIPSSPATCRWTARGRATRTACASPSRPKPA